MILTIKVTPKSSKSTVVGWEGELLKVRLKAAPEKGEANKELIRFLSKELKIPQERMSIVRGHKGRIKQVRIEGLQNFDAYGFERL